MIIHSTILLHNEAVHLLFAAAVRSAFDSTMEALQLPTIRVVAVIAEGVPERDTKLLIAFARANNKIIIGPATVGGMQVGRGASKAIRQRVGA